MSLWLVFLRFACDFLTDFRTMDEVFFVFVDNGAQKILSSGSLMLITETLFQIFFFFFVFV